MLYIERKLIRKMQINDQQQLMNPQQMQIEYNITNDNMKKQNNGKGVENKDNIKSSNSQKNNASGVYKKSEQVFKKSKNVVNVDKNKNVNVDKNKNVNVEKNKNVKVKKIKDTNIKQNIPIKHVIYINNDNKKSKNQIKQMNFNNQAKDKNNETKIANKKTNIVKSSTGTLIKKVTKDRFDSNLNLLGKGVTKKNTSLDEKNKQNEKSVILNDKVIEKTNNFEQKNNVKENEQKIEDKKDINVLLTINSNETNNIKNSSKDKKHYLNDSLLENDDNSGSRDNSLVNYNYIDLNKKEEKNTGNYKKLLQNFKEKTNKNSLISRDKKVNGKRNEKINKEADDKSSSIKDTSKFYSKDSESNEHINDYSSNSNINENLNDFFKNKTEKKSIDSYKSSDKVRNDEFQKVQDKDEEYNYENDELKRALFQNNGDKSNEAVLTSSNRTNIPKKRAPYRESTEKKVSKTQDMNTASYEILNQKVDVFSLLNSNRKTKNNTQTNKEFNTDLKIIKSEDRSFKDDNDDSNKIHTLSSNKLMNSVKGIFNFFKKNPSANRKDNDLNSNNFNESGFKVENSAIAVSAPVPIKKEKNLSKINEYKKLKQSGSTINVGSARTLNSASSMRDLHMNINQKNLLGNKYIQLQYSNKKELNAVKQSGKKNNGTASNKRNQILSELISEEGKQSALGKYRQRLGELKSQIDKTKADTNVKANIRDICMLLNKEYAQVLVSRNAFIKIFMEEQEFLKKYKNDDLFLSVDEILGKLNENLQEQDVKNKQLNENLKKKNEEHEKIIADLKNLKEENEKIIAKSKKKNEENEKIIADLKNKDEEYKKANEELQNEIKEKEGKLLKNEAEYNTQVQKLKEENKKANEELQNAIKENKNLLEQHDENLKNLKEEYEKKIIELQNQHDEKLKNLKEENKKANEETLLKLKEENEKKIIELQKQYDEKLKKLKEENENLLEQKNAGEDRWKNVGYANVNNIELLKQEKPANEIIQQAQFKLDEQLPPILNITSVNQIDIAAKNRPELLQEPIDEIQIEAKQKVENVVELNYEVQVNGREMPDFAVQEIDEIELQNIAKPPIIEESIDEITINYKVIGQDLFEDKQEKLFIKKQQKPENKIQRAIKFDLFKEPKPHFIIENNNQISIEEEEREPNWIKSIDRIQIGAKDRPKNKIQNNLSNLIILRKDKPENEIIYTDEFVILEQEKPTNEIEYIDEVQIKAKDRPKYKIQNNTPNLTIPGEDKPENAIEYVDEIPLEEQQKPENAIESIDEINLNSVDSPEKVDSSIKKLENAKEELGKIIRSLTVALHFKKTKIKLQADYLKQKNSTIKQKEKELAQVKEEKNKLEQIYLEKIESLQTDQNNLNDKNKNLKSNLEKLNYDFLQKQQELEKLKSEKLQLNDTNLKQLENIKKLEETLKNLKNQVKNELLNNENLNKELDSIKNDNDIVKQTNVDLQNKLNNEQLQNKNLSNQLNVLNQNNSNLENERTNLHNQLNSEQVKTNNLIKRLKLTKQNLSDMINKNKNLEDDLKNSLNLLNQSEEANELLRTQFEDLMKSNKILKDENEKLDIDVLDRSLENYALRTDLYDFIEKDKDQENKNLNFDGDTKPKRDDDGLEFIKTVNNEGFNDVNEKILELGRYDEHNEVVNVPVVQLVKKNDHVYVKFGRNNFKDEQFELVIRGQNNEVVKKINLPKNVKNFGEIKLDITAHLQDGINEVQLIELSTADKSERVLQKLKFNNTPSVVQENGLTNLEVEQNSSLANVNSSLTSNGKLSLSFDKPTNYNADEKVQVVFCNDGKEPDLNTALFTMNDEVDDAKLIIEGFDVGNCTNLEAHFYKGKITKDNYIGKVKFNLSTR